VSATSTFIYYTRMHVGVVLTPPMQSALYELAGRGDARPADLPPPQPGSFRAVRRRGLADDNELTALGHAWIKAEVEAAHSSTQTADAPAGGGS
jgi:hypothetical protein